MTEQGNPADLGRLFREVRGQALATLIRRFGDIDVAEDALQDAMVVATEKWPDRGVPVNPAGWLITTARNRAIDRFRREKRGRELHDDVVAVETDRRETGDSVDDFDSDRLRLVFTCCHPALKLESRVALTLRLIGGLTTEEVARAFLVSESTMAKRLVRAKYKIKAARIPYVIPGANELAERLGAVLSVVYLIYNAGADNPDRAALRSLAVNLSRDLAGLLPGEPEVEGLLALILLSESRIPARFDGPRPVLLRDQDRTQWDETLIAEGVRKVNALVDSPRPGSYQLQAAIQAQHCLASIYEDTDWKRILELYDRLYELNPTPVVAMNRAIALGEVNGPDEALAELDSIGDKLVGYRLWHAARGSYLAEVGRTDEAQTSYQTALELATTDGERSHLTAELRRLQNPAETTSPTM